MYTFDNDLHKDIKVLVRLIRKQLEKGVVYWSCISCGTEYCTDKTPNVNFHCASCYNEKNVRS
jgi:hypothetical protein